LEGGCWRFVLVFVLGLDVLIFISHLLGIEGLQGMSGVKIGGSAYFKHSTKKTFVLYVDE
jgi:hypothetical protein